MTAFLLVLAVGYGAGIVSGIVGTGATIILLPVLVLTFGPREAVPIMAIVALMSNVAKITAWWREIDGPSRPMPSAVFPGRRSGRAPCSPCRPASSTWRWVSSSSS